MNKSTQIFIDSAGFASLFKFNLIGKSKVHFEPIPNFDIYKFSGRWYEIARIDHTIEKNINNSTVIFSINEKEYFNILSKGFNYKKQKRKTISGTGKIISNKQQGILRISFLRPLYMDFNIIKLDCNYENALIAGKNHDYLWLFSREKFVDFKIKENFLLEASELGFNTKKLTWIRHD